MTGLVQLVCQWSNRNVVYKKYVKERKMVVTGSLFWGYDDRPLGDMMTDL